MDRRWAFSLILLALIYASVEGVAWLGLWWTDGTPFSPSRLDVERAERLATPAARTPDADDGEGEAGPDWLKVEILHPYQGFVQNPERHTDPEKHPISEFGFVDRGAPLQRRAEGRLIVGIFGGSMAQWFGLRGAPALAASLRASPALANREVVFVRTGLAGYKQPQQLMTLAYLLSLGAEFDLVLNLDGFNEIALHPTRNGQQGVADSFPTNWALRVQKRIDLAQQRLLGELVLLRAQRADLARGYRSGFPRYSPAANLLWRVSDRRLAARVRAQEMAVERYRPAEHSHEATGPVRSFASEAEMFDALVATWELSSLQMDRLCTANGIRYLHFLQPNQYVPDSKPMAREERAVALLPENRAPVVKGYARLRPAGRRLREAGVSFHDLTEVFAGIEEPLYVDTCCHVNGRGNRLLGEAMARAILAESGAGS